MKRQEQRRRAPTRPKVAARAGSCSPAMMIMIAGFLNFIWGIAAIDGASLLHRRGPLRDLRPISTPGAGSCLIIGLMQLIAAFSIWNRHVYGRFFGVLGASLNFVILLSR